MTLKNSSMLMFLTMYSFNIVIAQISDDVQEVSSSQIVDAGEDVYVCENEAYAEILGGNPTAQGDTGQYYYEWSSDSFVIGSLAYGIGDFIDDIYSPNPVLSWVATGSWTYIVDVYDADSNLVGRDSVTGYKSGYDMLLITNTESIEEGDSVFFTGGPNLFGGIPPITYSWDPDSTLSASNLETNFWAFPSVTTEYFVTLTDSIGCTERGLDPALRVVVYPTSVVDLDKESRVMLYPNPTKGLVYFSDQIESRKVVVLDMQGKFLGNYDVQPDNSIDLNDLGKGIYILKFEYNGTMLQQRVVLE